MTNRVSPQGLRTILEAGLSVTDITKESPYLKAIILDTTSSVLTASGSVTEWDVQTTLGGFGTLGIYNLADNGGLGWRATATATLTVDGSEVKFDVINLTDWPAAGAVAAPLGALPKYVLFYIPQATDTIASGIPLILAEPDFVANEPNGQPLTVTIPSDGLVRGVTE